MALTHNERVIQLEQRIQMLLDELTKPDLSAAERDISSPRFKVHQKH